MTRQEAIKYLKQLYPHGGCCWLDDQRIEAISMAVAALEAVKIGETSLYIEADELGRAWPVAEDSITDLIMPSDALKLIGTDDYCEIEVFVRRKGEE